MSRILIVDDSELVRLKLSEMLIQMGCEVCEASNGAAALALYESEAPTLVICDINMPIMNGLAFLQAVMEKDTEALVVMLSSNDDQSVLAQCLMLGAQAYLTKPFDPETTYNTLYGILGELL